jgi:hypothetical protein
MPVVYGDSRPSTRVRKPLGNLPRFRFLRVQANVTNRPMEVVPWSRLLTLAAVSNRKHRSGDPSSQTTRSRGRVTETTTVACLARTVF